MNQGIVHRPLQGASDAHQFGLEVHNARNLTGAVLEIAVAAFSQDIRNIEERCQVSRQYP
jgi:hypothetical protein